MDVAGNLPATFVSNLSCSSRFSYFLTANTQTTPPWGTLSSIPTLSLDSASWMLWEQKTPTPASMGMRPSTEVDGTEYVGIQSGGRHAQRIQDALSRNNVGIDDNVPQGGVVWVFAVKK